MIPLSKTDNFETFYFAFIECALWSSTDNHDEPLDHNYTFFDISEAGHEILKAHALSFYAQTYFLTNDYDMLGHDFWLTSCGHGTGFWDRDIPYKDTLTELSEKYPLEHFDLFEYIEKN